PMSKHLLIAQRRSDQSRNKFRVQRGEARKLDFRSNFFDLVILHGPLYHLQKEEDRSLAIAEASRVLKQGGIILGFAINYTASTMVGLLNGLIHNQAFFEMCKEVLSTGFHTPSNDFSWLLAEAFYHKPDRLKAEFFKHQLDYLNMHAVEGMAWLDKNYFTNMLDTKNRRNLMELIQITETDSNLLSFSPHIMIAVQKKY
uniref:class I SAM-dependent methyltransferase n=1 Tax=Enterococcus innesii TaxID=2839759 RepID=UPI003F8636A8